MAPSPAPPMTPSPGDTQSKRPRRMVRIIPAIPRSLEKKTLKEDVRSNKDGGGVGSPICPTSPEGNKESQEETVIAETQAAQNRTLNGSDAKDDTQENGVQEAAVEVAENAGSKTTTEEDGSIHSPAHAQDFGIGKDGFCLPPPYYPKRSPPATISSNANEEAVASEETSQTVEEEDGSNLSQQSLAENHMTLNAAAPTFHAHSTPPTDVTTSPAEPSYKDYDLTQSVHLQQEPTPPPNGISSPVQQSFQGYEASQNISFYAPPESSNDPSSPDHSIYQGYAYAPASYKYSPQSHAAQYSLDSESRTEVSAPYEQCYEPHPPCYSNQSSHPVIGSQPPLTPSRTPLNPSAPPWSYPNESPSTIPFSYGYIPSYHPQPPFGSLVRSTSRETLKSEESTREADLVDNKPEAVRFSPTEKKTALIIRDSWRSLNDYMSSHVPLVDYLLQQFNVKEYADCRLTLVHEHLRFEKTTWSLSSLLCAQSHKLLELLKSAGLDEEGKRCAEIRLTDRFVTPWAVNSALRVLYGERPEMFTLAMIHSTFDANAEPWTFQMDACLAFAAAGHVLSLDNVVLHALQIASSILDWDNLEHALSFGLESGSGRGRSASVDVIPLSPSSPVWSRESNLSAQNLIPQASSTESGPGRSGQPGSTGGGISSVSPYTAEVRSALDLQKRCLQWIASNLDDFWHLDPSARPLAEVNRLPTTAESRSPLFKSRLSRIQFGDHPSELHAKASDRNLLVSSIVLSIPFTALKYLLDVGTEPVLRQLYAIVKERETRRHVVLQSKSVSWSERLAAREHEWAEVGYTEWVETTGDGKLALARNFTGIDRQVSDPSTPDQQKR